MKAVNFWKTLFCSVLALTAFAACSDDDDNGNQGMPEITVNGGESAIVARDLSAGETSPVVEVVSNTDWKLSFENESDASWCTPSKMSGKSGTTQLTFNVSAATAARQTTVDLVATTTFEGIPIPKKVKVVVKQNEGGSTSVETNVKQIRDAVKGIATSSGAEITQDLTLTGIVISDVEAGGTGGNKSCYVSDNTTEPGSGLIIRFNSAYTYKLGQVITGSIKGGKATLFNNILQVSPAADSNFSVAAGTTTVDVPAIPVENAADLINYESQYVQFGTVQPAPDFRGKKWFDSEKTYSTTTMEIETGGTVDVSIYQTNTWAKENDIPSKSGFIRGIVSPYQGAGQIAPRNLEDVAGLTNDLFTIGYKTSTIGAIKAAGNYQVENAVVAANYESGFVMEDATGQMLVYQFIKGTTIKVPAVGTKVTVKGAVESKNGMLQFSPANLEVTENGTGTVKAQTATTLDGAAVTALFNAPVMKYIKYTGKLTVDGNYYNVAIDGTDVVGSISYPNADLKVGSFDGQVIDVEGWFIGATTAATGIKYLTTLATKVTTNEKVPSITFTDEPKTFAATNPAQQTLKYTANAAAGTVTFDITGTDAAKFKVVSNTATEVVIAAVGDNTSTAAYTAKLNAKGNGTVLASVDLKQAAPSSGSGYTLVQTVADLKAGTGYLAGFAKEKYQTWTGALSSNQCLTVPYTYTESSGAFVPDEDEAAKITLVAVDGVKNAYYIKFGEKYLTVKAAGKNQLSLADKAENNYWTFTDDTDGMKATAKAFEAIMMTSTSASSKFIRSYVTTTTTGVAGVVFLMDK